MTASGYSLSEVTALLGLSRPVITGLVAAGFVTPGRGPRREYRFSFQDIVLLRAALGLRAAQIPPRRILRSLRALRASLPEQMPLAGLRLAAVGNEVVVRDGGTPWQAESGQLLFDFEAGISPTAPAAVQTLPSRPTHAARRAAAESVPDPIDWFQRATELEATDPAGAQAAYRRAIAAAPSRADAYLNLGVLLGEAGRHAEAAAIYRQGIARCAPEALLHFNLAVTLEDLQQTEPAIEAYERCLALDPRMADAHFNLARLHDQLGRAKSAIRHYSAYRRLRQRPS